VPPPTAMAAVLPPSSGTQHSLKQTPPSSVAYPLIPGTSEPGQAYSSTHSHVQQQKSKHSPPSSVAKPREPGAGHDGHAYWSVQLQSHD